MRAAVLEDVKKLVYREDYPIPTIGANDALVRVHYCGICGSDVTNYNQGLYKLPIIMGHEFAGEIEELGENIEGFNRGDKVLGINVKLDVTREMRGLGIFQNGGYAEYVKVPKEFLFHAPASSSLKNSAMVESYALGMRAIKLSHITTDQKVVIIGGGNVGLTLLSCLLIKQNPKYIIVIEPHKFLREKAKEFGASAIFDLTLPKIKRYIAENGAPSFVFDCAGTPKSFKLATDLIMPGGTIILEGLYRGTVPFPLMMMNSKELCIKGVMGHDRADILEAIALFDQKLVDPSKIISDIVPLNDIQKAIERFRAPGERNFIKLLIQI